MNSPYRSRLVRLVVMALLLAGLLLLGLNPAAGTTPAENPAGQTVPTKTPTKTPKPTETRKPTNTPKPKKTPKPDDDGPHKVQLFQSDISCSGHNVRVQFAVAQLPNDVTDYGT